MHILISTSKKTKAKGDTKGWNRSKLLKLVMPLLSGGNGDDLIAGLTKKDPEKVKHVMLKITNSVVDAATPEKEERSK